jgi:hypothetical protein
MLIPKGEAILSEDGVYRAWITRELGGERPLVTIGINPSTADAFEDDNTIENEMAFTRIWGCGRLIKVNPWAYRARFAKNMWAAHKAGVDIVGCDIRGLHNDDYISRAIRVAIEHDGIVLFAWGNLAGETKKRTGIDRIADMLATLRDNGLMGKFMPMCLGTNKDGSPKHTLYQPHDKEIVPWVM